CPVTGEICLANVTGRNADGYCDIALALPAFGSVFVVFNRDRLSPKKTADQIANASAQKISVDGKWTVKFQSDRGAPDSAKFDKLTDWTTSDIDRIKYFSGTATYSLQFEMPRDADDDLWLDLHEVCELYFWQDITNCYTVVYVENKEESLARKKRPPHGVLLSFFFIVIERQGC
ncbi:MAG: hypothetical protein K9M57_05690, partial [Phycisphaerae bacterium]|nr:hypothetical protein [Phycisphaerae bacterium]